MNATFYSVITLGVLGIIAGAVLAYAARKFTVREDPRVEQITCILPGANCGACGYTSCKALAKAIVAGEASSNSCTTGGEEVAEKVAGIMGAESKKEEFIPKVAVVQCQGGKGIAKDKYEYKGIQDCRAAELIAGGHKACAYGCLGLGTCVEACPFNAIVMGVDKLPKIDENKCTGCGKCVEACPRNLITLIPREQKVYLACKSKDRLKDVKNVCAKGCIACRLCSRPNITPDNLITMPDNLPEIQWEKGKDLTVLLKQAVEKCPSGCFVIRQ